MASCGIEFGVASFKGIEFEIRPVQYSGGHRVITHLYPFTDLHYNENLGRKPERFQVNGIFHGENFRDQLRTAQLVWSPPVTTGFGLTSQAIIGDFFEPTQNKTHSVTLLDWSFDFNPKACNYVEFTLDLIEVGEDVFPGLSLINGLIGAADGLAGILQSNPEPFQTTVPEIESGFNNANEQLNDLIIQTAPDGFVDTLSDSESLAPSGDSIDNVNGVREFFEAAIGRGANQEFFERATRIEVEGNGSEQGDLFALTALSFLLESIADQSLTACRLRDVREIILELKCRVDNPEIRTQLDCALQEIAGNVEFIQEFNLDGENNALVASYELYGDISRSNELIGLSRGVSGSCIDGVVYRT